MSTLYSVDQMNQLGDAFEAAGFTSDDVTKLRSFPELATLKSVVNGLAKIVIESILRRVVTAQVKGIAKFVVKDQIQLCNIGWMGDSFKKFFLNLVEEDVVDASLAVHCLEKASLDAPILEELGDKAEIKLAYLFELLQKQSKGERGVLLVNGCANIVYVRGAKGALWAVYASWRSSDGDWGVEVYSVEYPYRWCAGYQVLSRDSCRQVTL